MHFPHKRHPLSKARASSSLPFWSLNIALLTLVPTNFPAVQLAVQLPHAIHLSTSGSSVASLENFSVSVLSRSILELGLRVKPNFSMMSICFPYLGSCGLQGLLRVLHAGYREEFWDLYMLLPGILRVCRSSAGRRCCPGF